VGNHPAVQEWVAPLGREVYSRDTGRGNSREGRSNVGGRSLQVLDLDYAQGQGCRGPASG